MIPTTPCSISGVIRRPNLVGGLIGKASAAVKISSQSTASRAKHLRDFDSLVRMLGPADRATADLAKSETKLLGSLVESEELTELGRVAVATLLAAESR